jgi:class 3 adenylate cyclase
MPIIVFGLPIIGRRGPCNLWTRWSYGLASWGCLRPSPHLSSLEQYATLRSLKRSEAGLEAERRQVTVLFADMVGFTSFSERSGEEAAFTLMRSLSKLMAEAVREQGGIIQDFTGDGIMAVFGLPVAFEDGPLRASRAALSILQRVDTKGPELEERYGLRPQMRIGLNTGPVVVGKVDDRGDGVNSVLGDTVNFAARLQSIAEPNSVFISEATHRLVQGLVDENFAGEQTIKGKSEPQNVYRLNAVRQGAARFEAAVSRGLSAFVGREHELEVLDHGLDKARSELRVIDLAAEPGMGKSRLLHEFRQRLGNERTVVLSGSCWPDGQQTPFLPFIEVVRGSFRISAGEAENEIARNLEMGLKTLGLHSARNLALLLHLLGLRVPGDALTGLDGLLIGLRTRELLQELLEARCRLSPVVMVIEDLHWIDSVSEQVLGKLIDPESKLRLLLLTTRRPEYSPPWLERAVVSKLSLGPLPAGEIRRLVQARLRTDVLPEPLVRQVTEKAEGNPLFTEEIVSFLIEQGIVRTTSGKLEFDASTVATALPASVQSLLSARVDRLTQDDRALLQAASVIGRQFEPQLLAAVTGDSHIDARLAPVQELDLVRQESESDHYAFKHALVRDALYQSLLTEARTALHLRIAEEIERRSGNRLTEVAEVLAHHFSKTDHVNKAFAYSSMAGSKSLSVYSLDEAMMHFAAALALLDKNPDCATDGQVADFLVHYATLLHMSAQIEIMIVVLKRYLPRIDRLRNDPRAVLIRHHCVFALIFNTRYREAAAIQQETSAIAEHLGDSTSKAYSLASEISVSMTVAPKPLDQFEKLKREAIEAISKTTDTYIKSWTRFVIGSEEMSRGRMTHARDAANELMRVGHMLNDPRSTGQALNLLAWMSLVSDAYSDALEYSEQCLAVAITPFERIGASGVKGCALVLLRRTEKGAALLEEHHRRCAADGNFHTLTHSEGVIGICKVLQGRINDGLVLLEEAIAKQEMAGFGRAADLYRLQLGEIYVRIITASEKLPLATLLMNLPILLKVIATGPSRLFILTAHVLANPHFDSAGHHAGHAEMLLGLLYKAKKKRALAAQHLTEAQRIFSQFGQTPILARVETALAELKQYA